MLFDTLIEKGILPEEVVEKTKEDETKDNGEENLEEEVKEEKDEETSDVKEEKEVKGEKKVVTGCNIEEILAVLSHELGHWYFSHTLKFICLSQVIITMRVEIELNLSTNTSFLYM